MERGKTQLLRFRVEDRLQTSGLSPPPLHNSGPVAVWGRPCVPLACGDLMGSPGKLLGGAWCTLTCKCHILSNSCPVYPQDYEGACTAHLSPNLSQLHVSPDCGEGRRVGKGLVGPRVGYGRHPANREARTPPHAFPGKVLGGSALHPGGAWQRSTCRQALKVSDLKPGKPRPHGPLRANKLLASSEKSKLDQISPPTHLGKNSDPLVVASGSLAPVVGF